MKKVLGKEEISNDVVAISSYCNTQTKIDILNEQIDFIKRNTIFKIAIHANYPLPIKIQNKVNHYFYENLNKTTSTIINVWLSVPLLKKKFTFSFLDTGYSAINQLQNLSKYLQNYDKVLFINYDTTLEKQHIINHTLMKKDLLIYLNGNYLTLLLLSFNPKIFTKYLDLSLENYLSIKNKTTEEKLKLIIDTSNISFDVNYSIVYDKITNMPYVLDENNFFKYALIHKKENILNMFFWNLTKNIKTLKIKINNNTFYIEHQTKNNSFEYKLKIKEEISHINIIEINGLATDIIINNTKNVIIEKL